MPRYSTQHYSTLQYTTLTTPHHNYNCNCNCNCKPHYTNYTTLQLQLTNYNSTNYTTATTTPATTTALHHTTSSSCGEVTTATIAATPEKHTSNHLSVHQWIRSAIRDSQQPISPIGFLFLKLPPPPCAVLLVIG